MYHEYKIGPYGIWKFGIKETHSKESSNAWKNQRCHIIEDVITGKRYLIPADNARKFENTDHVWDWMEKELIVAREKSDALAEGLQKGKLFSIGVADGCAWYEVVKVHKAHVRIEYRGYEPDRYCAPIIGYGGLFEKSKIEPYCVNLFA